MVKPLSQDLDEGTEQRIFDAADRVFAQRGTDGARMQEIAEEAGVNKALLHYYYRSKDQLAAAVFRRTLEKLLPALIAILASDLALEEKIERVVHSYLDELSRRPYIPGYVISEISHHPERVPKLFEPVAAQQMKRRVLSTLRRQIEQHVREGTLAPIAPEQFLINLIALSVFPFAARPLLMGAFGLDAKGFARFIDQRRKEVPAFIIRALRP